MNVIPERIIFVSRGITVLCFYWLTHVTLFPYRTTIISPGLTGLLSLHLSVTLSLSLTLCHCTLVYKSVTHAAIPSETK